MNFTEQEKFGLCDLLHTEENSRILKQLAKSFTSNIVNIENDEDAINSLFTHGQDASTVLHKRLITKEILFKYLTRHHIQIELNVTKAILVNKTIDFWKNSNAHQSRETSDKKSFQKLSNSLPSPNEVALAFAEWFFNKYNSSQLLATDFWPEAELLLRISANDGSQESTCNNAIDIISLLEEKKLQFGFFFNLNLTENGVQGRMDIHGMLLVLTCGTLHTRQECVGVFECLFGLLRDPFEDNNWKMKTLRCVLRSQGNPQSHTINESESLRSALTPSECSEGYG